MSDIKVSVLVPVYGVEQFMERCARSLFEQTMKEGVEYVFVNDCTKDRSIEILEKVIEDYPQRKPLIKIIHHETNKGLSSTRNTSIDYATGEYVCIVDSDDYVERNMVEVLYNKAIETNAEIVRANFFLEFKDRTTVQKKPKKRNSKEEYFIDVFINAHFGGRIYKRSLFEERNVRVPEHLTRGMYEDLAIVPKLYYYAKKVCFIDDCLYHYVQYNTQAYTKNMSEKTWNENTRVLKHLDDFFTDKDQVYLDAIEFGKIHSNLYQILTFIGNVPLQKEIFNRYKDEDYRKQCYKLSLNLRITYILAKRNLFWMIRLLYAIYQTIKRIR